MTVYWSQNKQLPKRDSTLINLFVLSIHRLKFHPKHDIFDDPLIYKMTYTQIQDVWKVLRSWEL
jgi:hypothetical protein